MAYKVGDKLYECSYCGQKYSDPVKADGCRDSHELVYIALSRTDLNRLLNFLYSKNDDVLTETLTKNLTKYLRGNRS